MTSHSAIKAEKGEVENLMKTSVLPTIATHVETLLLKTWPFGFGIAFSPIPTSFEEGEKESNVAIRPLHWVSSFLSLYSTEDIAQSFQS